MSDTETGDDIEEAGEAERPGALASNDEARARAGGRLEAVPPWFRLAAMVVFIAGTVAAVSLSIALSRTSSESVGGIVAIGAAVECGAIVLSAVLAFFAYALELMIDIRDQTRVVAELALGSDDEVVLEG